MNFLHFGGGAGDLDPNTFYRDGFSEFVKAYKSKNKNIFVVEANPTNIPILKKSWKMYKSVKVFNFAITSKKNKKIKFFLSENDGPYYQTFSNDKNHVKRHFPNSSIKSKYIKSKNVNEFFYENFNKKKIDYFSIDIEGSDYEVIMNLNLNKYDIQNISLEYLHLKKNQKEKILKKLIKNGYSYFGFGLDVNKIDWFFKKKKCKWNNIIAKFLPIIHRKHYKRLNKLLISEKM